MCNNYNQKPRVWIVWFKISMLAKQRGYNYCEIILNRFVRDMNGGKTAQRLWTILLFILANSKINCSLSTYMDYSHSYGFLGPFIKCDGLQ